MSWGLCRVTEGRECEPGQRFPPLSQFQIRREGKWMHGWGLLVWAVAYVGLKETAGDTVNSRGSGWACDTPPQDGPSSQGSGNIHSSKLLCLTFSREEAGGSRGPVCGELRVCVRSWW